jgi:putative endopeptidase
VVRDRALNVALDAAVEERTVKRTRLFAAWALLALIACSGWGFPAGNLDRSVSPAHDFYEFAVGGWRRAHPIPADRARWGAFDVLAEQTAERLRGILEEASAKRAPAGSDLQKLGDLHASGMDEAAIEAAGVAPLAAELERVEAVADLDGLQAEIAHLQEIGAGAAFDFGQMPDPKRSTIAIAAADQGGLGLPDRSDYLDDSPRDRALREAYLRHVAAMLALSGEPADRAARDAATILQMETALAAASLSRVERRDPYATYHPTDLAGLGALTPHFSWPRYFALVGRPDIARVNVGAPRFFEALDHLIDTAGLDAWRGYLRWHLVDLAAPYLSADFVREQLAFRAKLTGVQKEEPRWRRVLHAENDALGFALGRLYVERYFSAGMKAEAVALLHGVQAALRRDLATLPWMSPETRRRAIDKLDLMTSRIGYPDRWRDYGKLTIDRGPLVLNMLRANAFSWRRELDKIGKPVDRGEWSMLPQTVNAYYDPSLNQIVFPAGILQPPFFDAAAPPAWNHGAIGAVMGHEITHGFDDEGSRYDGAGNLVDWWTAEDARRFHARTQCIAEQFSRYTVAGGAHVNGALVTGEATADLGGVALSYLAYLARGDEGGGKIEGFTRDQLFFLSFANIWANNARPEEEALLVLVDPHPPARFRVNGTLANLPAFQRAFAVPSGSPMVNEPACDVW